MKRLFVLFVAMIVLVTGCAMYQAKRDFMPDNVFACNMPSVKVQLSSDFEYTGVYDKSLEAKSTTDPLETPTTNTNNEYFLWQKKDKSKLIVVQLSTLKDPRWYFTHKGTSSYTSVVLGGDKWYVKKQHNWKFNAIHYKKLLSIDSTIEKEYAIAKRYARIGINSNMMVTIYYVVKDNDNFTPDTDITILK